MNSRNQKIDEEMMYVLENAKIRVEYSGFGRLTVRDLRFGGVWSSPAPFRLTYGDAYTYNLAETCRVTVEVAEGVMRFRLEQMEFFGRFRENPYRKPENGPDLKFEFSIEMQDDILRFVSEPVRNLDAEPLRLRFTDGLFVQSTDAPGEAVLPCGFGGIFRFPRHDRLTFDYEYSNHYSNMPIGGLFRKSASGLLIRVLTFTDETTRFSINREHASMVSFDHEFDVIDRFANHRRVIQVQISPPGGNYNTLAKWYRAQLIAEGKFVTYLEKIAKSPVAENLIGAVVWKHNVYAQRHVPLPHDFSLYMPDKEANRIEGLPGNWSAYEIFDTAKQRGFDRVCIYNTGWNFMGFDSGYPVRLPPNPERGTVREIRAAAEYGRALSPGYIFSVHDNYHDTYENSPEDCSADLCRDQDRIPVKGGVWRGGRARLLCTACSMKYARRDIPRMVEIFGRGGIYADVFGCTPLQRCYDPAHPMTQQEDLAHRRELLEYLAGQFGSVTTEGTPADYYANTVHMGAFSAFLPPCANSEELDEPPLPVPLWQLVFHDSVLNYTCEAAHGPYDKTYLAYQALYNLLPTGLDDASLELSQKMRKTYISEMISHEFADDVRAFRDRNGAAAVAGRARTRFADGTIVEADFQDNAVAQYRIIQA